MRIVLDDNENVWLSMVFGLFVVNKLIGDLISVSEFMDKILD